MNAKKIGEFLASLRKVKGLTQQQLANEFFISNKTVSKWECGESIPDVEMLPPLAEFYCITVDEILAGERRGAGKANTEQTEQRTRDSQTKYLFNSVKSKFDLLSLLAFVSLALVLVLSFVLGLTSAYGSWTAFIVVLIVDVLTLLASITLFVVAVRSARDKLEFVDVEQLAQRLKNRIGKAAVFYWSILCTLVAFAFVNFGIYTYLFKTMIPLLLLIVFFVWCVAIFAKLFDVKVLPEVKSARFSKFLKFVARYRIVTFVIVAVSAVVVFCVVTDMLDEIHVDYYGLPHYFRFYGDLINSLYNYGYDAKVATFGIASIVLLAAALGTTIFSAVKNKGLSVLISLCLFLSVAAMLTTNNAALTLFGLKNGLTIDRSHSMRHSDLMLTYGFYFAAATIYFLVSKVSDRKKASA